MTALLPASASSLELGLRDGLGGSRVISRDIGHMAQNWRVSEGLAP